MTTRYQMKEMPDLQGTGEPITYPKMVMTGQTGTRELAEYIAMTSGFSKGVTEGIICELGEALAHEMGNGTLGEDRRIGRIHPRTVHLPRQGTRTAPRKHHEAKRAEHLRKWRELPHGQGLD